MIKKELKSREAYICPLTQIIHVDMEQHLMGYSKAEGDHNPAEDELEPTPVED